MMLDFKLMSQMEGWTAGQTDGQTETDGQTDGQTENANLSESCFATEN